MSDISSQTPAEILIGSVVKSVGKREFLKTVEKMFEKVKAPRVSVKEVSSDNQCEARVKGQRTGVKIGRFVLFEEARCDRKEIDSSSHLCAIHTNQLKKIGDLHFGRFTEELSDELRKTFV